MTQFMRDTPAPTPKILIPSHRRAHEVSTVKHVPAGRYSIVIAESQYNDYCRFHDKKTLICHPDEVIGLQWKRQWMYEQFGNIIMLDDDITQITRLYRRIDQWPRTSTVSANRFYDVMMQTTSIAWQMGAYLYGWGSHCNPASYRELQCFKLGGYILGGAMGIFEGSKNFWPRDTTLPVCDYFVSGVNAFFHRYAFIDWRFGIGYRETMLAPGGVAQYRHATAEEEATAYLRRMFGENVIFTKGASGITKHINAGARGMKLPYHS